MRFRFERIPVDTDEGWEKVQRRGMDGWDLVTVDNGIAYLRDVLLDMEDPGSKETVTCGSCPHYKPLNKKLGKCKKKGWMTGPRHESCIDHPDYVPEEPKETS
jgi:hypothetical protein